jgi:DNA topoisomerase VI subunit B
MGGYFSILPAATYNVAERLGFNINETYYKNPSVEILYDEKGKPCMFIAKDISAGRYTFKSPDIYRIHTVFETNDVLIQIYNCIYAISSEINILSKPKRSIADCESIFDEIAGYITQFRRD